METHPFDRVVRTDGFAFREVVLFPGEKTVDHDRLWDIVKDTLSLHVPAGRFASTEKKLAGFKAGYGTVLFFDDAEVTRKLMATYPSYKDHFPLWAQQANGMLSGKDAYPEILAELARKYPHTAIILTLGKHGLLYKDSEQAIKMGTYLDAPVVDTTAAGDTFIGYFLAGVASKWPVTESLQFATAASSVCVGRAGASPSIPYAKEVSEALAGKKLGELR